MNRTKQILKMAINERVKKVFIKKLKEKIKDEESYREICEEKGRDISAIDEIDIDFIDLDVSARTINKKVDLNEKLLEGPFRDIMRYVIHEVTHVFQQENGEVNEGSADKSGTDYLDDDNEEEAFSFQVDYMKDHYPDDDIIKYLEQLLDHHEIFNKKDRKEKIKELCADISVDLEKLASIENDLISQYPELEEYINNFVNNRKYLRWYIKQLISFSDKDNGNEKLSNLLEKFEKNINLLPSKDINHYTFESLQDEIGKIDNLKEQAADFSGKYFTLLKDKREEYYSLGKKESRAKAYEDGRMFLDSIEPKALQILVRKEIRKHIGEREKIEKTEATYDSFKRQVGVIYEDGKFLIIRPLTIQSAIYFGRNTKWCTSMKEGNRFHDVLGGVLYIINKEAGPDDLLGKIGGELTYNDGIHFVDKNDNKIEESVVIEYIGDVWNNKTVSNLFDFGAHSNFGENPRPELYKNLTFEDVKKEVDYIKKSKYKLLEYHGKFRALEDFLNWAIYYNTNKDIINFILDEFIREGEISKQNFLNALKNEEISKYYCEDNIKKIDRDVESLKEKYNKKILAGELFN